jgi:hypothetical protein
MSVSRKSGTPVLEPGEEESINRDEYGNFKDTNAEELNFDTLEEDSLHSSRVGTVNADMEDAAISGSKIGTLNGDFHLGKYTFVPFQNSEIGEIFGDVVLEENHEIRGTILRDTVNSDNTKYTSRVGLIVGDRVKGKKISDGSGRSVILADEVEVEDYNDEFVLTPDEDDGLPTFEGDFDALKEEARREGEGFLQFSGIFGPDFPGVVESTGDDRSFDRQELEQVESELEALLEEEIDSPGSKINDIKDGMDVVDSYPLETRYQIQMVDKVVNDIADEDDAKREKVDEFGSVLQDVDEEIFDLLKTEKDLAVVEGEGNEFEDDVSYSSGDSKFGKTLFEIATGRTYNFFIEEEAEQINELLELEADLPDLEVSDESVYADTFEEDSPYLEMLGEVLEEFEDDVSFLRGLAEVAGEDYAPDFGLSKKEGRRKHDPNFEPEKHEDFDSLREHIWAEAEKDIRKKKRYFTKEAIKNLGFREGADRYEEATGERPEELTRNEIAALKVRERFDRFDRREMVDTLLTHGNDVYELEANQEWLDEHGFEAEEIVDPDLSGQSDGIYERPDDSEYRSELKIDIDPGDVLVSTEREKQQYWDEITGLLDSVGHEGFVSDIDEAEEAVEEIESPDDVQDYRELKDAINNYNAVDKRAGGVPDELSFRVSDPMDTTRMGHGFGSCHDIDGGSYAWASIANAIDANKMVFYAEDSKGRERARVKAFVTDERELVYHNTSQYKDIEIDTSDYFEGYMERVSDELGLDLKHSSEVPDWEKRTELLEATGWYSGS